MAEKKRRRRYSVRIPCPWCGASVVVYPAVLLGKRRDREDLREIATAAMAKLAEDDPVAFEEHQSAAGKARWAKARKEKP